MPNSLFIATTSSCSAVIEYRIPDFGDGISVSTLSVDISTIGSSIFTNSPTFLSHLVTVPSVIDSPSSGIEILIKLSKTSGDKVFSFCVSIIANSSPISTVESSLTTIFIKIPAVGEGISVSTLSVDTSKIGSFNSTFSPSFLSQRVTVPSVKLSPKAGI